jgi:preprotein translocase subunit SecE
MNEQEQQQETGGGADRLQLTAAAALVVAGIVGYYWLSAEPDWERWLAMFAGLVLAALVFAVSPTGRGFWRFVLDSRIELRKVIWPTRQETIMTTVVVVAFVTAAGFIFWVLDIFLYWATKMLTGQGS